MTLSAKEYFDTVSPYVKGKKICILTPTCTGFVPHYLQSLHATQDIARGLGCEVTFQSIIGQSVLPKARNQLVYDVLEMEDKTGPVIPVLIDADIGWSAWDLFWMIMLFEKHQYPVLGGNYPKKQVQWDALAEYVNLVMQDEKPEPLTAKQLRIASQSMAAALPEQVTIDQDGVCELQDLPAGFVIIRTSVFRALAEHVPSNMDSKLGAIIEIPEWFNFIHVGPNKKGVMLGEDIALFRAMRKAATSGEAPWGTFDKTPVRCYLPAQLSHTGTHVYTGCSLDEFQ